MDSVCKNMQSSPYHKDQIHYGPYYYPGAEGVPAQMYVNPPRPPVNYGYWPWGNSYGCGYASPGCHGCCNHTYWPSNHAWGSPHSHVPPFHCPGGYSISPVPVPCIPPPFYAMEQPQYEYEKNVPRDHRCCGCPNHPSHQKEQKNVKIEEEELDGERRENDYLVPFKFKNEPPVVWLPPDFNNNKEYRKPNNLDDSGDVSGEAKPNDNRKTVEQQPSFWNGWYPLDLNNLVSWKQVGEGERNHHQIDEGKGHFPFPLFWIPYKPEGKEGEEQHKVDGASAKSRLESEKGSGGEQNFYINGENVGGQGAHRAKDIPVKKVEQREEKESPKNKVKESDASVKDGIGNGGKNLDNREKELPKHGARGKSPSSPKSSKLPPICLRVDPLPRRKGTNESSRSPSPPGDKQKVDQLSKEASKVSSDNNKPKEVTNSEFKAGKGITKTIDVVDGKASQGDVKVETPINRPVNSQEDVLRNRTEEKPKEESVSQEHVETDEAVVKGQSEDAESAKGENEEKEVKGDEAKGSSKRKLSEEEAAVIIQSAYRGFDVRRWESVKKLKQIAKVREQIAEVKQLIQAMESSSDIQDNSKQRNIIAETIMSLLLKLDTIQGLHLSVRDIRKSVVRELVSLQEKLDSLMNKRSQASAGQESIMGCAEDALKETEDVRSSQNGNGITPDLREPHQNGLNCQSMETKEANLIADKPIGKSEEAAESCVPKGTESASEPTIENVEEKRVEVCENVDTSIAKEDHTDPVLDQSHDVPLLPNTIEEATDFASAVHGQLESELAELPVGAVDDLYSEESTNERAVNADTSKDGPTEQLGEGLIEAPITSESHNDVPYKGESKEQVELAEIVDVPFSGDDIILEAKESLNNCKSDLGTEEEVGSKFGGDALYVPDECPVQQPENVTCDVSEPCEASDESELPIPESDNSLMSKGALETPPEDEISRQPAQECAPEQESSIVIESANTHKAVDMIEAKEAAEDKAGEDETGSGDQQAQDLIGETQVTEEGTIHAHPEMEVLSEHVELPKGNLEAQSFEDASGDEENASQDRLEVTTHEAKNVFDSRVDPPPTEVLRAEDELNERNRKLIEENERLREMMEKLIQSGQEQLTAISSLCGRVKDLEKRLSRKKKLKMKHYRAPRSPKQRTVEVAM